MIDYDKYIGCKFGRLTVIGYAVRHKPYKNREKENRTLIISKCECGNINETRIYQLTSGKTSSCGCYKSELVSSRRFKHGDSGKGNSRIYQIWSAMRARCAAKSGLGFKNYKSRGITVCSEWNDFINFKSWSISNGYNESLEIDRIDNDGNYSPDNCRWTTREINSSNKRSTLKISYLGETKSLADWCKLLGLKYREMQRRISHRGWTVEEAFLTPIVSGSNKHKKRFSSEVK